MSEAKYIKVRVQPKSGKLEFKEKLEDGTLKFRLKAAPENGEANKELFKFLAKALGCKRDEISLVSGHNERTKLLRIPAHCTLPW